MKYAWIAILCLLLLAASGVTYATYSQVAKAQTEGDVPPQIEAAQEAVAQGEAVSDFAFADYFEQNWLDKLMQ